MPPLQRYSPSRAASGATSRLSSSRHIGIAMAVMSIAAAVAVKSKMQVLWRGNGDDEATTMAISDK
jgi:hypothetical protein